MRNELNDLREIAKQFLNGEVITQISPLGNGHINDSYLVRSIDGSSFVLQRINHNIFKDVDELMNNYTRVCDYFNDNLDLKPSRQSDFKVLNCVDGKCFFKSADSYWRMITFIEGSISYDIPKNGSMVTAAGKGFGQFLASISEMNVDSFSQIIPKFHDMEDRLRLLDLASEHNLLNRLENAKEYIDEIAKYREDVLKMDALVKSKEIPLRLTHNDTKLNNILFDKDNMPICVIDLDTVMPGSLLFDYGDAIRTSCNTGAEDAKCLNDVSFNFKCFELFTDGFLEETKNVLVKSEKDNLVRSIYYMTLIMAIRFLTDYLNGDVYYKTEYPDHNLQRTRVQLKLLSGMKEREEDIRKKISRI